MPTSRFEDDFPLKTYTNYVPFVLSCPSCGEPHQTSKEMAQCSLANKEHSTLSHWVWKVLGIASLAVIVGVLIYGFMGGIQ